MIHHPAHSKPAKAISLAAAMLALCGLAAASAAPKPPTLTPLIQFQGSNGWTLVGHLATLGTSIVGTSGGTSSVIQLTPPATTGAPWQTTMLHSFGGNGDGEYPNAGVVALGGNLYGSTQGGGNTVCGNGCGTIFQLVPPTTTGGAWTENQLIAFNQDNNGYLPDDTVAVENAHTIFGTTVYAANDTIHPNGSSQVGGVVFELTKPATGPWKETVLHHFDAASSDGDTPFGGLIIGPGHILYGTTFSGGKCNQGIVYSMTPPATKTGSWSETHLHDFGDAGTYCNYNDGEESVAALTLVGSTLYGTTRGGGAGECGTLFSITLGTTPTYQLLYTFGQTAGDSCSPQAPVRVDTAGNIYGTTDFGGGAPATTECAYGCGTIFELSPQAGGTYANKILYAFTGQLDGSEPRTNLLGTLGKKLRGMASHGGFATDINEPDYASYGTFFQFTP